MKGSKTEKNLLTAFAGESQARNRYTYFAGQARKDGFVQFADIFIETAASGQPQQGTAGLNGLGTLMQGYLETSNVNVVQELVTMIQTQRAYEMNSKAIQTSDQMLQKLGQL